MAFDVKAKIEELATKIKNDAKLREKFQKEPVAAVEELLGIDLPDEQIQKLVDGIKAKIAVDNLGSAASALGSIFGKK